MVKVLVLGATGKQGGATARALLSSSSSSSSSQPQQPQQQQRHVVRAYVRDPSAPKAQALAAAGAELVAGGDWESDAAALDRALAGGVEAVFFPSAPSFADPGAEVRGAANIVEAARRAGTVTHVVYSSVVGVAQLPDLIGWDRSPFFANYWNSKAKTEELVRTGGFAHYTILRPTEFMSNYTAVETANFQIPDLIHHGVLRTAHPADLPLSLVDVADIGRTAAAALEAPDTFATTTTTTTSGGNENPGRGREIDVVAQRLTPSELVAQLGAVAGKKLSAYTYTAEEAAELAKTNPVIAGQIARKSLEPKVVPNDFGLGFVTFKEYLEKHREEVVELYKNAP
ncbi:hypothetical protein Hte_011261 [Hypoxylon texense]